MKLFINAIFITLALLTTVSASAATPTETFGVCLVDNLNGKERKKLAKWIFFSMAAHPEMKSYLNASAEDINSTDMSIGSLITRLLTEDCAKEMQAANRIDPRAIEQAFGLVGEMAMQELVTDQTVATTLTNYIKYTDQEKVAKLLSE